MNSNITDGLNFMSKLTPKRVANMARVVSSYYLSKWTKKVYKPGMPFSISFEPTTSCNLRCPECPSGLRSFTRPTGMLQDDLFKKT
ncbi:MAG: radical SAM protein, partial [Flammeovirgaceae bacterium]